MICHACGSESKFEGTIPRGAECPQCNADIHCCLNCNNHDKSAHNQCREPHAEWVADREKANFCDFFMPNRLKGGVVGKVTHDAARRAFDDLFKK